MPKRSRSGRVIRPERVVAPIRVKGARSIRIDRAAGPSTDDQVELEVLHRRVEDLLDRRRQPVDLVDEQDVARLQVGQQCGEIAAALDHRARGGTEADAHFAGDDLRERRLAEPRRSRRTAHGRGPRRGSCAASMKTRRLSRSWRWPTNSSSVAAAARLSAASCSACWRDRRRAAGRRSSREFLQPGADQRTGVGLTAEPPGRRGDRAKRFGAADSRD